MGNFPILIKVNCDDQVENGIDKNNFPELAEQMEKAGVDAIEVSCEMWNCLVRSKKDLRFMPLPIPESRTWINAEKKQSYFASHTKNLNLAIPIILVGGNKNIETLEKMKGQGHIDFFSFSRPLICEPDLPNRWLEGRGSKKADCISCNTCVITLQKGTTCLLKEDREKHKYAHQFLIEERKKILK